MSRWEVGMVVGLVALGTQLFAVKAQAEPLYRADTGDSVITVHSEPCAVQAVGNLPKRATWQEKGKTYEGCAGQHPQFPILIFYFAGDKSVVVVPVQLFQKVTGT